MHSPALRQHISLLSDNTPSNGVGGKAFSEQPLTLSQFPGPGAFGYDSGATSQLRVNATAKREP